MTLSIGQHHATQVAAVLDKAIEVMKKADEAVQKAYQGTDGTTLHHHARYTHSAQQGYETLRADIDKRGGLDMFGVSVQIYAKDFNNGLFIMECMAPEVRTEMLKTMKEAGLPVAEMVNGKVTLLLRTQLNAAGLTTPGRSPGGNGITAA